MWRKERLFDAPSRARRTLLALVVGGVGLLFGVGAGIAPAAAAVPNTEIVVHLDNEVGAASVLGGVPGLPPQGLPGERYVLSVPEGEVAGTLVSLRASSDVQYAEVPETVHATDTTATATLPNDPCLTNGCTALNPEPFDEGGATVSANQANLTAINAVGAWALSKGSPAVTVAVLDTGADLTNPDLAGKVIAGANVCGQMGEPGCGSTPTVTGDGNGHGSHVAGIVGAHTDNGVGVASLGWNTEVLSIQVLNNQGAGNTADVATGIYDAVADGARVINLSLSNDSCAVDPTDCGPDPDEQAAVDFAIAHNVVVVAAAGNDGLQGGGPTFPASYPGVLSVAATDNAGDIAPFSESGQDANIAAPGIDVVSTWNDGGLAVLTGTSMSTPQVSAAAALMIAARPDITARQVVATLEATARPITAGSPIAGGVLDAGAALAALMQPGYTVVGSAGQVDTFGAFRNFGSAPPALDQPVVGMAVTPDDGGYWLVASDGGIFAFGDARFFGSMGGMHLNQPIVGMASTPDGEGYWLVASDGGVFAFGDARFFGSMGGMHLNQPIVGMASTPDRGGYWLVASDGGVFAFGDARFFGSMGGMHLNQPIVGMARPPTGAGYWLVASDGGIFSFGSARFFGSTGAIALVRPIAGMARSLSGDGYRLVASDGGIFSFGNAPFLGSIANQPNTAPIVGIAGPTP